MGPVTKSTRSLLHPWVAGRHIDAFRGNLAMSGSLEAEQGINLQ